MIILSASYIEQLFFVSIRLGTVLLFTPISAIKQLPILVRLMLIFSLSLLFTEANSTTTLDNLALALASLAEAAKGLMLAASIYASFAVFAIAGHLIENQMGLNALAIFNPAEHSEVALSSHLLSMLAILFFFNADGHLWLLKGLAYSFLLSPPGSLTLFLEFTAIIKQFGLMFSLAFMIASPLLLTLLLIELGAGLLTRSMPQMNTWFLVLPIKIVLGFVVLRLMMDYLIPQTNLVFESLRFLS